MKQLIWGFVTLIISVVILLIISTVNTKTIQNKDVESDLAASVNSALETVMENKTYTVADTDELIADLIQTIISNNSIYENTTDSDDDYPKLNIGISQADKEKGLIGLKITEEIRNSKGKINKFTYDKVAILDADNNTQKNIIFAYFSVDNAKIAEYKCHPGADVEVFNSYNGNTINEWIYTGSYNSDISDSNKINDNEYLLSLTNATSRTFTTDALMKLNTDGYYNDKNNQLKKKFNNSTDNEVLVFKAVK